MYNYKISLKDKNISETDKETLNLFLKMLDFSSEYLSKIYSPDKITFCVESKKIIVFDLKKHDENLEKIANSYGFNLVIQ